jgi:hypothetical protein
MVHLLYGTKKILTTDGTSPGRPRGYSSAVFAGGGGTSAMTTSTVVGDLASSGMGSGFNAPPKGFAAAAAAAAAALFMRLF